MYNNPKHDNNVNKPKIKYIALIKKRRENYVRNIKNFRKIKYINVNVI